MQNQDDSKKIQLDMQLKKLTLKLTKETRLKADSKTKAKYALEAEITSSDISTTNRLLARLLTQTDTSTLATSERRTVKGS